LPSRNRLLGLALAGIMLIGGAFWLRSRWDPNRYHDYSVAQLESWIAQHPDDGDALYELGKKYRAAGQVADARQAFERALRQEPGNARLMTDLGELLAARGEYPAAQALFEQAIARHPELAEAHRNLGDLAGIAQNFVLAIQHYRRALALQPNDVKTLTSLGSAYADALNRGEAEAALRKAIRLAPNDPEPYQRLGLALFKLRDYASARTALQQALAHDPNDRDTHFLLGLVLAQQLQTPDEERQALEHLDRAVELGYNGGEDDYGRGLVYLHRKDYPRAIASLETAVRQDAGGDDARYRLGRAYLAVGQTARGEALLKQFERLRQTATEVGRLRHQLALQPDDLAARRRLARLCLDTGRYHEALQQFRILATAGAADADLYAGMERAALAVGDTRLAEQARAGRLRAAGRNPRAVNDAPVPGKGP
jgi:tetratricopeptide (TPR) repeat protein